MLGYFKTTGWELFNVIYCMKMIVAFFLLLFLQLSSPSQPPTTHAQMWGGGEVIQSKQIFSCVTNLWIGRSKEISIQNARFLAREVDVWEQEVQMHRRSSEPLRAF